MSLRQQLFECVPVQDLLDIIIPYSIAWGDIDINSLNRAQKNYLKEGLFYLIQKEIPTFEEQITDIDIEIYNHIHSFDFFKDPVLFARKNGSLNVAKYYSLEDEDEYL